MQEMNATQYKSSGSLRMKQKDAISLIDYLIASGYLEVEGSKYPLVHVTNHGWDVLDGKNVVKRRIAKISVTTTHAGEESDTLFEALPGEFSINESAEGDLEISLEKFMRSSSKANSYNQRTDTFFIFAEDYVIVLWQFDYNGLLDQWMKCSYTLNGNNITLNELIGTDSNNQWTWSSKTLYGLTDCDKGDLPFYPDYK